MVKFFLKHRVKIFLLSCLPCQLIPWFQAGSESAPQLGFWPMLPFTEVSIILYCFDQRKDCKRRQLLLGSLAHIIIVVGMIAFFLFSPILANIKGEIDTQLSLKGVREGFWIELILVIVDWFLMCTSYYSAGKK